MPWKAVKLSQKAMYNCLPSHRVKPEKTRFTLPASFREGDVLELEAFDKEGKSICNWTYPIRLAKQYFDHKMAQTPMTLEAVQPATATQTATSIELKSEPCNRHF